MWEEGVRIYGTPGVHNIFPRKSIASINFKVSKTKTAIFWLTTGKKCLLTPFHVPVQLCKRVQGFTTIRHWWILYVRVYSFVCFLFFILFLFYFSIYLSVFCINNKCVRVEPNATWAKTSFCVALDWHMVNFRNLLLLL